MRHVLLTLALLSLHGVCAADDFHATACEGTYPRHLQGICTDGRNSIYWCFTEALVKTDRNGHLIKKVPVASHHGDLCYHDRRVFVATNLDKFNQPTAAADSWVYVYDANTLAELAKHRLPEVVHGAGGMAYHDGKSIVIGGLPPGVNENHLYEYNENFRFHKSVGIAPVSDGCFLIAQNTTIKGEDGQTKANQARVVIARADEKVGLVIEKP